MRQLADCFVSTIDSAPVESIVRPLNSPCVVLIPTVQALEPSTLI